MTVEFVQADAQEIYDDLILQFQQVLGETLYQGDERRIFLEQESLVLVALYNAINSAANQNLLRNATGEVLDAIGERTNVTRLPAQNAATTLRFTLSSAQPGPITVPVETRATPDGKLFFATAEDLVIAAGNTTGYVQAESTQTGDAYNGFTPGQISQIVDPVAFVSSVANIDTSTGGADIEADDDGTNVWSGFRERIRESVTSFSTAGPEDAYIYWAKSANSEIGDVAVTSPAAGEVKITVLMAGGEIPVQSILDAVLAVCNDKKVRPLTDHVTVEAPTTVSYDIALTYYIGQENAASEAAIRSSIEGTDGAVDQYKLWQKSKLGKAVNPDYLRQLMLNAGAQRITLIAPAYTALAEDEVAIAGAITITYGGLE